MTLRGYIVTAHPLTFDKAEAVFEVAATSDDEALALVNAHPAGAFYQKLAARLDTDRQIDISGCTKPMVLRFSGVRR